ncbi:TIGR04255 family protein [Agrobacterium rhizogenes]|nr:TIGR04255 family protein [Rhizobium rhizogenes]NTI99284.1 TIGR04255 family protein [Rhizobium rhizogenes]
MTFVPKSGAHALVEVVWGLTFSRPFSQSEIESAIKERVRWSELPRVSRTSGFQFILGNAAPAPDFQFPIAPGGGVSFDRVNPDGTLAWRLKFDQNNIFVSCLQYTRWADIWPKVQDFLNNACDLAVSEDNLVTSAIMQFIDVFEWEGDKSEYSTGELLNPESRLIPSAVFDRSQFWHLHQGWFDDETARGIARIHQRIDIDGVEDGEGLPIVKIDSYIQHQLHTVKESKAIFASGWIEEIFGEMHQEGKRMIASLLTPDMARRIDLNVE